MLGTLVVEVEADDGTTGFAVTTGGELGACIVEKHLARFVEGQLVTDVEKIWDQMYLSTLYYGRKGIVLNAISGVDLALWDLLGRVRQEPVYHLLGGAGPRRADLLRHRRASRPRQGDGLHRRQDAAAARPGRGRGGPRAEHREARATMRERVGDDFWLMFDCWMSLDLDYATRLAHRAARVRPEVDRGGAAPRRLLGLRRAAAPGAPADARDHRRARGHALGLPPAARHGLLRHPPAGRRAGAAGSPSCGRSPPWPTRTGSWWCRTVRASTPTTS